MSFLAWDASTFAHRSTFGETSGSVEDTAGPSLLQSVYLGWQVIWYAHRIRFAYLRKADHLSPRFFTMSRQGSICSEHI